jgi:hypothetical protein
MDSAEYHAYLQKAEDYVRKAKTETDWQTKRALEAVAREFFRRAQEASKRAKQNA